MIGKQNLGKLIFALLLVGGVLGFAWYEQAKEVPFEKAFETVSTGHPRIESLGIEVWREKEDLDFDNPMNNAQKVAVSRDKIYAIFTEDVFKMSVKQTDVPPELSYMLYATVGAENVVLMVGKDGTIHQMYTEKTYMAGKDNPLLKNIENHVKAKKQ